MMDRFQIEGPNAKVLENLIQAGLQRQSYFVNVYFVIFMTSISETLVSWQTVYNFAPIKGSVHLQRIEKIQTKLQ